MCVFLPLEKSHEGLSFYACSGIVIRVIIAAVFDYTDEKHSEEANYIKLL